ncbi:MAG: ABC transporter permease [Planctomycetes bacterium]|nr:ABC transporter permease [Planctomycetota bacterium]
MSVNPTAVQHSSKARVSSFLSRYGIYIVLLALCVIMTFLSPYFLTGRNLLNILNQVSIIGIVAIGATVILLGGGIDLTPGSVVAVAGVCAAHFGHPGEHSLIVPLVISILIGLAFGMVNGFIVAKGNVVPFIVTLGVMTAGRGIALLACDGYQVGNLSQDYIAVASGRFMGIPYLVIYFAVIFVVFYFLMHFTKFGRHVYAVGGNEIAAHASGVNVDRVKMAIYVIGAVLAAIGGFLLSSRTAVGSPIAGLGYELDAIASAVIGGTSTTGGVGRVSGTIIGALIIQVIANGLDMLGVQSYWQQIVKGAIIVLAVYLDVRSKQRR